MRCRLLGILALFVCPGLYSLGSAENRLPEAEKFPEYTLKVSGIIRLVGSEPFARLLVSADDGKNYIVDESYPERKALQSRQGQRVYIEGTVREYPVYAGKKYIGIEYFITPTRCDTTASESRLPDTK
ncbi:MAG: hypothetical protein LBT68_03445 [Spirochaetales bacterium]|jgi:hypothetical protein|nr:hypothetical protein [Spirochaetales bacterium]